MTRDHSATGGRDCTDNGTGCCGGCGVDMSTCPTCGGIGYHFEGCVDSEETAPPVVHSSLCIVRRVGHGGECEPRPCQQCGASYGCTVTPCCRCLP